MMADQKIQESPVQEDQVVNSQEKESKITYKNTEKTPNMTVPVSIPIPIVQSSQNGVASVPLFTKAPPSDLYRRLLPAVLFLLTFVTVMTMLLIYMDTVALGAQQFRLNMSRDYELASIPQDSASLITYVRQLHLTPKQSPAADAPPVMTRSIEELDKVFGADHIGTFIEIVPSGPRSAQTAVLEARGWAGTAARAAPRDYLSRPARTALHACVSATGHPREIAYNSGNSPVGFSSRVLCLPIYSMLAAADCTPATFAPLASADCTRADYTTLAADTLASALTHVPFDKVHLKVIEIRSPEPATRIQITEFLMTKNYTILATFDDSVMYKLN